MHFRARVTLRQPARIVALPPLARALVGGGKPRGLRRLRQKAAKATFALAHRRLRLPARAVLELATRDGVKRVAVDGGNTAFLALAAVGPGGWEPALGAFVDALAPASRVFWDIGANWGGYALRVAGHPGFGGVVHAFEAAPRTASELTAIVAASGLGERITTHAIALSDAEGTLSFTVGRHSMLAKVEPRGGMRVPARRLDGLGLPDPDLVKIDVEGHEEAVLRGAAATLERARPIVTLESWYRADDVAAMLAPLQLLAERGYRFYRLLWEGEAGGRTALALDPPVRAGAATLALLPMTVAERPALPFDFDVVAIPEGGMPAIFEPA